MKNEVIDIGIIGGSGFCTFPEIKGKKLVDISEGQELPSDKITIGTYGGKIVAFLPRHGYQHQLAPHVIPYKANVLALKKLGVKYIFAFCVAGSLKKKIRPGDFVVFDQFVNLTWGRDVTFKRSQPFIHLPMADPYSDLLRKIVYREGKKIGLNMHKKGTVVVIQGPRFNTRAESDWFTHFGWDSVNMTQYPECYFAKELGIDYSGIAAITDYDVALQKYGLSMAKQKITENSLIFKNNIDKSKKLIKQIIINWDKNSDFQEQSIKPQTYY
jgi:5'-methylthioadenosine phosphorylase